MKSYAGRSELDLTQALPEKPSCHVKTVFQVEEKFVHKVAYVSEHEDMREHDMRYK
jgi:hypothetical protein